MLRQLGDLATVTVVPASTRPTRSWPSSPTGSSCPTARATPPPCPASWTRSGPGRPRRRPGVRDLPRPPAAGHRPRGTTYKLPFGHHGGNHPVRACRRAGSRSPRRTTTTRWPRDSLTAPRSPTSTSTTGSSRARSPTGPGVQRAVPPRGRPRAPRRPLPVRGVPDPDGRHRCRRWRGRGGGC
jgi:hypothetical protein